MGRKSIRPELEAKLGKPLPQYLDEAIKKGKKVPEIASEIGISQSQTYEFINRFGLKSKFKEAAKQLRRIKSGSEIEEVFKRYIQFKENEEIRPRTIENYRDVFDNFLWWLQNMNRPTTIHVIESPEILNDFVSYLKTEEVRFGGRATSARHKMEASSIGNYLTVLKTFARWCEIEGLVEDIEKKLKRVAIPKVRGKKLPEDLSDEAIKRIFNSFGNDFIGIRNRTIITILLETGIRLEGLCSLKENSFDLETGLATITEKGEKERWIHLNSKALNQLKKYLEIREELAETDSLWITYEGTEFKRNPLRAWIGSLSKIAGEHCHTHIFRHVWAKYLALSDFNPLKARTMGGWNDVKLYEHYASAYTSKQAWEGHEEASAIEKLL